MKTHAKIEQILNKVSINSLQGSFFPDRKSDHRLSIEGTSRTTVLIKDNIILGYLILNVQVNEFLNPIKIKYD